jgi:hypothetical protein
VRERGKRELRNREFHSKEKRETDAEMNAEVPVMAGGLPRLPRSKNE